MTRALLPSEYVADNGNVCGRVFMPGGIVRCYVRLVDGSRVYDDAPRDEATALDAYLTGDGLPDEVA